MAAQTGATMSYSAGSATGSGGEPRSLRATVVSAPYFEVFGTRAALGRTFARDEDQPGREKVTVIGHRLWVNLFGRDTSIVGRDILLNGEPYTVIGVLPGNSEFDRRSADLWIPLAFPPKVARDYHYLSAVARLKPGVSLEQAQAEMSAIAERHRRDSTPTSRRAGAPRSTATSIASSGRRCSWSLRVLMTAVVAVLLIGVRQPREHADGARDAALARDRAAPRARRQPHAPGADAADGEPDALVVRRAPRRRPSATGCFAGFRACCRRSPSRRKPTSRWTAACCCSWPA